MTVADALTRALEPVDDVRLAVLFGSAAKGALRADSDLDVGLLMANGRPLPPALQVTLERTTGRAVDLTLLDLAPPLLRFEIARGGVVLLARDPHAWADFRAHAMIDWWDWAPTARMMHAAMAARLEDEAAHGSS
jgi:uncharacterized protein